MFGSNVGLYLLQNVSATACICIVWYYHRTMEVTCYTNKLAEEAPSAPLLLYGLVCEFESLEYNLHRPVLLFSPNHKRDKRKTNAKLTGFT